MKTLGFSLSVLLLAAAEAVAATVTGSVSFVSRRGQAPVARETVVWLEAASLTRPSAENAQMITRNKTLFPHVMTVPVGSTVRFPNEDPIIHNLFSLSASNPFDLGLYKKNAGKSHKFDKAGIVTVYCNVHPNMSAVIHVMDTPFYTFADANGAFSIENVPAGRYKLTVWNEKGGTQQTQIEVTPGGEVRGTTKLTIDARNYRATQHLNKNNQPYSRNRSSDY